MTPRRYLVTGGLGFLGRDLARALLRAGAQVRILDNESRGNVERVGSALRDMELVIGDVRDANRVEAALKGCDAVCHLAAINGTRNFYERPAQVLDVGVRGTLNVLDACLRHGVGELLFMSSSEVYQTAPLIPTPENVPLVVPDPHNPRYSYAGSKIIGELLSLHHGHGHLERVLICRPHNVYGPDMGWDHVIPELAKRIVTLKRHFGTGRIDLPIQGSGDETRAFVYIDDFTSGVMHVLARGEHLGIYHIGNDNEVTIRDLAQKIARFYHVSVDLVPQTPPPGATARRCPSIEKVRALGYAPMISLAEGLSRTLESFKLEYATPKSHTPVGPPLQSPPSELK